MDIQCEINDSSLDYDFEKWTDKLLKNHIIYDYFQSIFRREKNVEINKNATFSQFMAQ